MIYDQHVAIVAVLLRSDELQSIVREKKTQMKISKFIVYSRIFIHKKLVKN